MKKFILFKTILPVIVFSSCSLSGKIKREATEYILHNEVLINAHTGICVYEPASGKYWYNYQGDKYFIPASNTKLATCYAAMKYLGDSLTGLQYAEINDSTVVINGTGDPSFLNSDYTYHPVYNFLKKYKHIEVIHPDFNEYLGSGWAWDDYMDNYMVQRSAFPIYGNIVRVNWSRGSLNFMPSYFQRRCVIKEKLSTGFIADKLWDSNNFIFSDGMSVYREIPFKPDLRTIQDLLQDTLHELVSTIDHYDRELNNVIHSQPTDSLLKPMMYRSDNFYAEQSLLMVSNKLLGTMNERKVIDTLLKTDFQLMPQKPTWVDGSGLSRYNLFSPKDLIFILNKMKADFGMERIKNILPTGGTGTISNYYLSDSGYIFVKTGSLTGVIALCGFLYTKKNKLLIFSFMVNNHRSSGVAIRKGIEKFINNIRKNY